MAKQIKNAEQMMHQSKIRNNCYKTYNLPENNLELELQNSLSKHIEKLKNEIDSYLKESYHLNKNVKE
jgi:hypothetical protein